MRALLALSLPLGAASVREPPVATLRWLCDRRALHAAISLFGAPWLIVSSGCYNYTVPDPEAAVYHVMDYPNLVGSRLVGDPARPGQESAALAGSCIDTSGEFALDLQRAAKLQWATGAEVEVEIGWLRPCGCGFFGECTKCGPLVEQVSELDPRVWQFLDYGSGPRYSPTSRLLTALAPGRGGLRVAANRIDFPSVTLRAAAPTRMSILRASTAFRDSIVPGEISQLQLRRNERAVLAVVLVDEGGMQTCGSLPLEATSSDPSTVSAIAVESSGVSIPGLHANGPLTVHAGGTTGSATLHFKVSGLTTDLPVQVVE